MPILPAERDPRLITIRRGGTLTDAHHHLLAEWSAQCVERVLPLFEADSPDDPRPREALALRRSWMRGEATMKDSRRLIDAGQNGKAVSNFMVDMIGARASCPS